MTKKNPSGYEFDIPETVRKLLFLLKEEGYTVKTISRMSGISVTKITNCVHIAKDRSTEEEIKYRRDGTKEDIDALLKAFPHLIAQMPLISKAESEEIRNKTKSIDKKLEDLITREDFVSLKAEIREIKDMLKDIVKKE